MSAADLSSRADESAFLRLLKSTSGSDEAVQVAEKLLDWARQLRLNVDSQDPRDKAHTGYVFSLVLNNGQKCKLFRMASSGELQFCTGKQQFAAWFQQHPPLNKPEGRQDFHQELKKILDDFSGSSERREEIRYALRSIACVDQRPEEIKGRKPKLLLTWLPTEEVRRPFLEAMQWAVEAIREGESGSPQ